MNVSPEQIRAATRSAAAVITPDKVPPLRVHEAPASHGLVRHRPVRHRPGRRFRTTWAAPLGAVAAVLIIVAGSLAASSWFAKPGNSRSGAANARTQGARYFTSSGAVPAYYVEIGNPSYAAVKATATGAVIARIASHTPFVGVTGAASDRTFVLDAQRQVMGPTVQWLGQPAFYLLQLTGSGAEKSLGRLAIPALPAGTRVTGLALSPDGSKLAIYVSSGDGEQTGRQEIMVDTLATGKVRTWSANGPSAGQEDPGGFTGSGVDGSQSISWTADSRTLAFEWGSQSDVTVRLLDTAASGNNLITESRLGVTLNQPTASSVPVPQGKDDVSQCVTDAIVTPDGSSIVCGYTTTTGSAPKKPADTTTGFLRYSTRTGKVARVFGVSQFRGQSAGDISLYWTNSAGDVLIGAVLTPSGARVGIIDGETFTPLSGTTGIADAAW